jgi:hypothetical protein
LSLWSSANYQLRSGRRRSRRFHEINLTLIEFSLVPVIGLHDQNEEMTSPKAANKLGT